MEQNDLILGYDFIQEEGMIIDGAANEKTSQNDAQRVETIGGRLHFVVLEEQQYYQKQ
jgi:hypothetical protein